MYDLRWILFGFMHNTSPSLSEIYLQIIVKILQMASFSRWTLRWNRRCTKEACCLSESMEFGRYRQMGRSWGRCTSSKHRKGWWLFWFQSPSCLEFSVFAWIVPFCTSSTAFKNIPSHLFDRRSSSVPELLNFYFPLLFPLTTLVPVPKIF